MSQLPCERVWARVRLVDIIITIIQIITRHRRHLRYRRVRTRLSRSTEECLQPRAPMLRRLEGFHARVLKAAADQAVMLMTVRY